MTAQEYLALGMGVLWMVTNILGAAFTRRARRAPSAGSASGTIGSAAKLPVTNKVMFLVGSYRQEDSPKLRSGTSTRLRMVGRNLPAKAVDGFRCAQPILRFSPNKSRRTLPSPWRIWSMVHWRGDLSGRQRNSRVPWRKRPPLK